MATKKRADIATEYTRIGEINQRKGVTPALGLCKLFEESGELAQAVNVEIGIKNGEKKLIKANVKEECADAMQNIMSVANLFKISFEDLVDELSRKNGEWDKIKRKADKKKNG
jgi:NTP pyrophosphatase (non-canonical NTP hydrolase)